MVKKTKKSLKNRYEEDYKTRDSGGIQSARLIDASGYEDVEWFSIKSGINEIDIIPYEISSKKHPQKISAGELDYKLDFWAHKFVGASEGNYVCLKKTYGKPCPICEEIQKMIDSDEYNWKDDAVRSLTAKRRIVYNVVDLSEEDEKIKLFETSHFEFQKEIIEEAESTADAEGEFITFADLEGGYTIKFRGSEREGDFRGSFKPKSFKFIERDPYDEDILKEAYPLDDMLIVLSYDEIKNAFFGIEVDDEDEQEENEKPARKSRTKQEKNKQEDDEEAKPVRKRKTKKASNECPAGGDFGKDCDELEECKDCEIWDKCSEEFENNE